MEYSYEDEGPDRCFTILRASLIVTEESSAEELGPAHQVDEMVADDASQDEAIFRKRKRPSSRGVMRIRRSISKETH